MKTENTTVNLTTFADVLRTYERYATDPNADPNAYANALQDLATAVTYSVLKKCINVSQNPLLVQMRQDLAKDLYNLDCIDYTNKNAYEIRYNADGERYTAIIDKDLHKALQTLTNQTLGNGMDLLHDAIVCILAETTKAKERNNGTLPPLFMEQVYSIRRLKQKVWIKTNESVNGWETATTTAIQETYKAVRRAIDQNRALQVDPTNGYTYIDDIATDPESGADEIIYRRFGKYADIGGTVTDINGKETAYTTDRQTVQDIDRIIERLNLTARESKILQLRLSGYGYKAIATYMGISVDNAKRCGHRLQEKAVAIGFTPCTK